MLGTVSTFPRISQLDLSSLWMTVAAATLALTDCIVLYAYEPGGSGLFPSCPFRAITGLHCPGCGTLRGLHQLLHGNLVGAFDFIPLMVLAIPFIGHAVMSDMVFKTSERRLPGRRISPGAIWGLLGLIIAFWILRNIPVYPLSLLAP